ncbi:MAG: hypothetical protein H7Y36_02950, partial [Armatimonadetes bacterium]|nr:hypothetical protein [Akkermansiaceae bacterium]
FEKPDQTLVRIEAEAGLNNALSAATAGISKWPARPENLSESLRWHLPKTLIPPFAALALVALGLFIPISARAPLTPPPSRQPQAWSRMDSQLEQLSEQAMVDEKYLEEMKERLEQLRAQEEEEWFSHASLEATDSLKESQASDMENLERDLANAENALEALADNAEKMSSEQKQKITEEFEQAIKSLENGAMKPNPALLEQLSKLDPNDLGKLTPDQLSQLKQSMGKLQQSLKQSKQGGETEDDWEEQLLGEGEGEEGDGSGSGGIQRGPGHDPNVLKNGKDPLDVGELTALEAKDLSRAIPGDLLQLQDGKHTVNEDLSKSSTGGTAASGKGGERVWKDSLAPDEQRALKKYFE